MNNTLSYVIFRVLKIALIIYILYLIISNFLIFLAIIGALALLFYLFIYNKIKTLKQNNQYFKFNFNQQGFQNFNANRPHYNVSETEEAKRFFGFSDYPTKDQLKKRYRELAHEYHPDINGGDESKMQKLNHYRDILESNIS